MEQVFIITADDTTEFALVTNEKTVKQARNKVKNLLKQYSWPGTHMYRLQAGIPTMWKNATKKHTEVIEACPRCGSHDIQKHGRQHRCQNCARSLDPKAWMMDVIRQPKKVVRPAGFGRLVVRRNNSCLYQTCTYEERMGSQMASLLAHLS